MKGVHRRRWQADKLDAAQVRAAGDDRLAFDVTVTLPCDTPARDAAAFRVGQKR